jgi:alkylated DNA nucleotide flippase Atl1
VKPASSTGRVEQLFVKPARGKSVVAPAHAALYCTAGLGIAGDVHANRLSPRQILITLDTELDALSVPPGALHENIVISLAQAGPFVPGAALVTAGGVEIRLTMYCEPCQRVAHLAPSLRALIHRRGILGTIVRGGAIVAGDALRVTAQRYPALPVSNAQLFMDVMAAIPRGRVLRYADVAIAMGVADSVVRALPGYIRRHGNAGLPLHRIVNAKGQLPALVPDQAALLEEEGIALRHAGDNAFVADLARCLWTG